MRTTVDLTPAVHHRAKLIADQSGRSLSRVIADLTVRGLAQLDEPTRIVLDDDTGFPTISIGRPITVEQARALADED